MLNTLTVEPPKVLKPFQTEGSVFLFEHPHALLADEPGLGKTIQAIGALNLLGARSVLVVCPASVRQQWKEEIASNYASGVSRVISYDEARNYSGGDYSYDVLILDEAHFLKTADSQRTQAIFGDRTGLARSAKLAIWALTGSPVLNRPRELWPILKCLHPGFAAMTAAQYDQRYCGAYFDGRAINNKGATRLDELNQRLDGFMLRRTKAEVMPQLPPKIITRVPLDVTNRAMRLVREAEDAIANRESKISSAAEDFSQLGDLAEMLHYTGLAKIDAVGAFVEDLLETQEKVVVFFRHTEVGRCLYDSFWRSDLRPCLYQGGMSDLDKHGQIEYFKQSAECRVFVGQIQAAGTGINGLQEVASSVVFAELSWVPGEMSQAIDRLHRMGQEASSVNVYITHIPGSLESAVLGVQNAKGSVIGRLMGEAGWRA